MHLTLYTAGCARSPSGSNLKTKLSSLNGLSLKQPSER